MSGDLREQEASPARRNALGIVFHFGRKKAEPKEAVRAKLSAAQKRTSFRMPVEFDVLYTLRERQGRRHGRAMDLSSGGLRLATDEDLLDDSVLDLDFELPEDFLVDLTIEKEVFEQTPFGLRPETMKTTPAPFAPIHVSAVVLSTFFVPATKALAHGTKFVEIATEQEEELRRYVHLWQLHEIRRRHESDL